MEEGAMCESCGACTCAEHIDMIDRSHIKPKHWRCRECGSSLEEKLRQMIYEICGEGMREAQEFVWGSRRYIDTRIKALQKRVRFLEKEMTYLEKTIDELKGSEEE